MSVILISGKSGSGKSTFANLLAGELKSSRIIAIGDTVKGVATTIFGWNRKKDVDGRGLLQGIGETGRAYDSDMWIAQAACEIASARSNGVQTVIIPDVRYLNEITYIKELGYRSAVIRIERPGHKNGLTPYQQNHPSETDLDSYLFDYTICNNGPIEKLRKSAKNLVYRLEKAQVNE